jgi:hypothetical protein
MHVSNVVMAFVRCACVLILGASLVLVFLSCELRSGQLWGLICCKKKSGSLLIDSITINAGG